MQKQDFELVELILKHFFYRNATNDLINRLFCRNSLNSETCRHIPEPKVTPSPGLFFPTNAFKYTKVPPLHLLVVMEVLNTDLFYPDVERGWAQAVSGKHHPPLLLSAQLIWEASWGSFVLSQSYWLLHSAAPDVSWMAWCRACRLIPRSLISLSFLPRDCKSCSGSWITGRDQASSWWWLHLMGQRWNERHPSVPGCLQPSKPGGILNYLCSPSHTKAVGGIVDCSPVLQSCCQVQYYKQFKIIK